MLEAINIARIEKRILMRDIVYEKLKDAIKKGTFKPHTRMIEEKIAALIGTSRTPIREVFQKLEKDGMIYKRPSGGYAVSDNQEANIEEYFELLAGLLGYAVFLATKKVTNFVIHSIEEILSQEEKSFEMQDADAFYCNNLRFYKTICAFAKNTMLFKMLKIENIMLNNTKENNFSLIKKRLDLHKKILLSMRNHEPLAAERYARKDIAIMKKTVLTFKKNIK